VNDSLAPDVVEPYLLGRFGKPYVYQAECESTQLLIAPDAAEGTIAVCEYQSAGRGRLGRRWEAPAGTPVHCSIALHPPVGRGPQELTLVGALAVAEAVEAATSLAVEIKWPNDVLLDGRKIGGVLGELRDGMVVLGIGVNVNQTQDQLPADARQLPGSLRTVTGRAHDRAALLASLVYRLEVLYGDWRVRGLPDLSARDFLRGRRVTLDGVPAQAVGIDRSGRLELEIDGERRLISSGEVEYER
jgi:BirA family biotin operon repressor/biotin-[acetyl-CoA-carboxylase] ligase